MQGAPAVPSRSRRDGQEDVCVTGAAWSTALGDDLRGVWSALLAGADGFRPVPSPHRLRSRLAAALPAAPESPADLLERHVELAVGTARRAIESAGIQAADPRLRLVLATSLGVNADTDPEQPLDAWADRVAAQLGMAEPPLLVSTACSSGSDSVALGAMLLRAGTADVCVCGGIDVLTPAKRLGHSSLRTMSPSVPRPFDVRRDGMLLGEGAAYLVLELPRHAAARGAPVRARLCGYGHANDASGATSPDPSGGAAALAMRRALGAAGIGSGEVSVVNAHGTATALNDDAEARALGSVFCPEAAASPARRPVVFATKAALGHTLGATGTVEAITVLLALDSALAPPVRGLETPLEGFPLPLAQGGPAALDPGAGLSLTLGFGGFNTCLVFRPGDTSIA